MSSLALKHLNSDEVLAEWIAHIGPIDVKPRRLPPFVSLTMAIVYQQLSGRVAEVILQRFKKLFSPKGPSVRSENDLTQGPSDNFPTPKQVLKKSVDELRTAGLSRPKAIYIHELAQRAQAGFIPSLKECDAMTDEEIIENLIENKGIGQWTAEMLLIFNLGRPDVLPIHDLGIQRGYQIAYRKRKLPTPKQMLKFGTPWSPYRTLAARYLWRIAGLKKLPGN